MEFHAVMSLRNTETNFRHTEASLPELEIKDIHETLNDTEFR